MATGIINKNAAFWGAKAAVLHTQFDGAWEGYFSFGIDAEGFVE
ncbi:hypothetical protein [Klebsiella pneumoniae]|nr:hypothetical protein [Klebsiella pneumoniae]